MERSGVTAVLLISCRDQKGLVAAVSDFVYRHDGNIIHADQHTDEEQGVFLQRVEWELDGFHLPRQGIAEAFRPTAERFAMTWDLRFSDYVPRIAVLVSKLEHCLHDLLWRQRIGEFRAEIPLVIGNHPDLGHIAEGFGAEFCHYPITPETRAAQERRMLERMGEARIDLVVLARAVNLHLRHGVLVYGNKTVVFD